MPKPGRGTPHPGVTDTSKSIAGGYVGTDELAKLATHIESLLPDLPRQLVQPIPAQVYQDMREAIEAFRAEPLVPGMKVPDTAWQLLDAAEDLVRRLSQMSGATGLQVAHALASHTICAKGIPDPHRFPECYPPKKRSEDADNQEG